MGRQRGIAAKREQSGGPARVVVPALPAGPLGVAGFVVPALPELKTLLEPASWLNLRGHVDRSVCFEITAKEAMGIMRAETVAARNGQRRLTTCCGVVRAADLEMLHQRRRPRTLRGDYRWRTRTMRLPAWVVTARQWREMRQPAPGYPDHMLGFNPNKGNGCRKVLGLGPDWRQGLRVESWELGWHRSGRDPRGVKALVQAVGHYLICPCPRVHGPEAQPDNPPPLSTRPRGENENIRGYKGGRCGQRVRKLFLPLCWPEEWADAQRAQVWLHEVARLREHRKVGAAGSELEALVVARYDLLFAPRRLLCNRCLGLAYGLVQPRQMPAESRKWFKWKRAVELPDPFARNRLGHRFAHDQLHHPLPKSALKNEKTRRAALAEMGLNRYGEPLQPTETKEDPPLDDPLIERLVREELALQKDLAAEKRGERLEKRKEKARAAREEKFRKQCAGLADWEVLLLKAGLAKRGAVEPPPGDPGDPGEPRAPELVEWRRKKRMLTALKEAVKKIA